MSIRNEVLNGIGREIEKASESTRVRVRHSYRKGAVWTVGIEVESDDSRGLDESYEGAVAKWQIGVCAPGSNPQIEAADVLWVDPESQELHLRYATAAPPDPGGQITIWPARYLDALHDIWSLYANADRITTWKEGIETKNRFVKKDVPGFPVFADRLRERQQEAVDLVGWQAAFLRGPPGTGKTFAVGAMIVRYWIANPNARILILATTNSAADQALISVDERFAKLQALVPLIAQVRAKLVKRIGHHFQAFRYAQRQHLLPGEDGLHKQIIEWESQQPPKSHIQNYAAWKQRDDELREAIRKQMAIILDHVSIAAMTTTRAAFTYKYLLERAPFDLLVVDEASQVSLAHALALGPLGKRVIFAGDPEQLSPIVQSKNPFAKKWLGRSMFAETSRLDKNNCTLNEQSRMAEPICDIVSSLFYHGELELASDVAEDEDWHAQRELPVLPTLGNRHVHVEWVDKPATWSKKYRGNIRYDSAKRTAEIAAILCSFANSGQVLVLTPFRAQRALIRTFLTNAGLGSIRVGTVHSAQGSECHTVIFDPVAGKSRFLNGDEGKRLINVAISRTQARLVVLLSNDDLENPILAFIGRQYSSEQSAPSHDRWKLGSGLRS
jgi:hypothetical protein